MREILKSRPYFWQKGHKGLWAEAASVVTKVTKDKVRARHQFREVRATPDLRRPANLWLQAGSATLFVPLRNRPTEELNDGEGHFTPCWWDCRSNMPCPPAPLELELELDQVIS